MFHIIPPGTKFDFVGKSPSFAKLSIVLFLLSVAFIALGGLNFGLDFKGGHQILMQFDTAADVNNVRGRLGNLFTEVDTSVQSYENSEAPDKTFYLIRIERSESIGQAELEKLQTGFKGKYGDTFKALRYNPESGDVVELDFTEGATNSVDLSDTALTQVVKDAGHEVRVIRRFGRSEQLSYSIVLRGVDTTLVEDMKQIDPSAQAVGVEFVGPTVGKQLRDDGILAVLMALVFILIYIALRFDFFYSPGAIICLFHDSIITVALLGAIQEEFSLATIAGILTLVGYSINDTIVIFDRIRETVGKAQGAALHDVLNRAINETLGRTAMTSLSTMLACLCLMALGRGTVLASFGLIMSVGIVIGTYSSIFVATPVFKLLRERYGETHTKGRPVQKPSAVV